MVETTDSASVRAGNDQQADVVLIGAGIMSATLGLLLKELAPELRILMFERLDGVGRESSDGMNNAGTGHAGLCELNYTPEQPDGTVAIERACKINQAYELSLAYWAYLVERGVLSEPQRFIRRVPHMSFVWGDENVAYLRRRWEAMREHPFFADMQYTEDPARIAEWAPLLMRGRQPGQRLAASRVERGTDVDLGTLTRLMVEALQHQPDFQLFLRAEVADLRREADGAWRVLVRQPASGQQSSYRAPFVFIGAGGGALPLLCRSGIPEGRGYAGFPVSGLWLVCRNPDLIAQHSAKVYGRAEVSAPPMAVPHLDTRYVEGRRGLLFGPYAGVTTKFLKYGSVTDLPRSLRLHNVVPFIAAGFSNLHLVRYLIGQAVQSPAQRMATLRSYLPTADPADWELAVAGQRVQIIKRLPGRLGSIEFGTEVVTAADGSLAALLGASPGASTAVSCMVELIQRCFPERWASEWRQRFAAVAPWFDRSLAEDRALLERVRRANDERLGLGER